MADALTRREQDALGFIGTYLKAHGIAPATHEICIALRLSPGSRALVARYIDALVAKGYLRRLARRARGIELVETEQNHAANCPCSRCSRARYLAQLQLVQAIQVPLPVALRDKSLYGIAPVSELTKIYWLRGFPRSLRPARGAA